MIKTRKKRYGTAKPSIKSKSKSKSKSATNPSKTGSIKLVSNNFTDDNFFNIPSAKSPVKRVDRTADLPPEPESQPKPSISKLRINLFAAPRASNISNISNISAESKSIKPKTRPTPRSRSAAPQRSGPAAPQISRSAAPQRSGSETPQRSGPAAPRRSGSAAPRRSGAPPGPAEPAGPKPVVQAEPIRPGGPPPKCSKPPRSHIHLGSGSTDIRRAVEQVGSTSQKPNNSPDDLRPKKRTLTPQQEALFQGNTLRPKKKVLGQNSVPGTNNANVATKTEIHPPQAKTVEQMIHGNSDLVQDCINVIIQCDPDQKCSKDELIARIEYQKNQLLKRNQGVRDKKIIAMEKILHDLRNEQMREGMATMEDTRKAQNKLVLANYMEEDIYKQKIDLTLPENRRKQGDDINSILVKDGRNWWRMENKKKYKTPTKIEAAFKQTRGNKKLPKELARKFPGY